MSEDRAMSPDLIDRAALRAEITAMPVLLSVGDEGEPLVSRDLALDLIEGAAPRAATEPPPIEVRDVYFYEAGLAEGRAEPLTRERLHEARHPFIPGAGRDAGYCDCGEIVERLAALTPTSAPEPGS